MSRLKRFGFVRVATVGVALLATLLVLGFIGYRFVSSRPGVAQGARGRATTEFASAGRATVDRCLDLLKQTAGNPALLERVEALVADARRDGRLAERLVPSLMVVTYHERENTVDELVVQIYETPEAWTINVLNPDGVVRARLGDDLFGSAENLMQLLYHPVRCLGEETDVARQQRAVQAAIAGDLTLLREQTIEPLHVVAVMPCAGKFLPGSLRSRVHSVVVDGELDFAEWRGQVALVTDDEQTAQQVGNTVAAWREIAAALANRYAAHSRGLPLRQTLEASAVRVSDNQVIASAGVPSETMVLVFTELAGHGGGCPATQITANFTSSATIPAGRTIWFNSVLLPSGMGTNIVTICVVNQQITGLPAGPITVPDAKITFGPGTCATTSLTGGRWETVADSSPVNNTFVSAVAYVNPSSLPGSYPNITWTATFLTDTVGVTLNWAWAAAVYTNSTFNAATANVKATDTRCGSPNNSDLAGSPRAYRSYNVAGARGAGGNSVDAKIGTRTSFIAGNPCAGTCP